MLCIVLQSHNRVQLPSSRDSSGWYPSRLAVPFFSCMFGLVSDLFQTLPLKTIRRVSRILLPRFHSIGTLDEECRV
jgi:hypothetical protein